jgi:acetaldehyde dehydrogenase/alcohol dehydrogenase
VGQRAATIAKMAGVEVPNSTKILIGEVESVDISEEFAHEKLSPVLAMYHAATFDEAIAKAEQLVADGGYGHTSSLYIDTHETEKMAQHAAAMKTCRILVNTPSSQGGIGDLYNFHLAPSLTLGCGSWGGNSSARTWASSTSQHQDGGREAREHVWYRVPEKVYFSATACPWRSTCWAPSWQKARLHRDDTFLYMSGFTSRS